MQWTSKLKSSYTWGKHPYKCIENDSSVYSRHFLVGVQSWKRNTFANVGRQGREKHTIRQIRRGIFKLHFEFYIVWLGKKSNTSQKGLLYWS